MRKKQIGRTAARRERAMNILNYVRSYMGCQICGEKDYNVLEFHHVIPVGKNRTRNYQSLTVIEKELTITTVVCANDHARITKGLLQSPPPMGAVKAKEFVDKFRLPRKPSSRVYTKGMMNPSRRFRSKLDIIAIRNLHPEFSYNEIAWMYKVTKNTIVNIVKRRTYADVI